jgi:hypothetical protein
MRDQRRWRLGTLSGVVLLAVVLVPARSDAKTTISLDPTAAPPTKAVTVSGAGFSAGEPVNVRFDATKVGTASADTGGAVRTKFAVPADATPGTHGVKVRGKTSGNKAKTTLLVRTNWRQYGFDNARGGANPYENVINPSNVAGLHELWSAPVASGFSGGLGHPTISDGILYVGSGRLDAIDLATHQRLWRGVTHGGVVTAATAYADLVFVVDHVWSLYAFPANCGSGDADCAPIWKTEWAVSPYSPPVVSNGVVYVGGYGGVTGGASGVAAYPAWCGLGGAICTPLWTVDVGDTTSAIALEAGVLYAQTRTEVVAVDVASHAVLWRAPMQPFPSYTILRTSPAVGDGLVFVSAADSLYAYPIGCATDGSTCPPRWIGQAPAGEHPSSTPTVADGKVFVQTDVGNLAEDDGHVLAFSTTCGVDGATCTPEWVAAQPGVDNWQRPAVANGVVYVGGDQSNVAAFGVDCASGGASCTPLWTTAVSRRTESLIVADGVVYWTDDENILHAFGP